VIAHQDSIAKMIVPILYLFQVKGKELIHGGVSTAMPKDTE